MRVATQFPTMYRAYCRLAQLSTRLPLILLAVYVYGTLMTDSLIHFFENWGARRILLLPEALQLTTVTIVVVLLIALIVSALYNNLRTTTILLSVAPLIAVSVKTLTHTGLWRIGLLSDYWMALLFALSFFM